MPSGIFSASITNLTNGTTASAPDVMASLSSIVANGINNDSAAIQTDGSGIIHSVGLVAQILQSIPTPVTASGASGTLNLYQILQGTIKAFILYFNGYKNTAASDQTLALPVAFTSRCLFIAGNIPTMTIWNGASMISGLTGDVNALSASGGTVGGYSAIHPYDFGEIQSGFDHVGGGNSQSSTATGCILGIGV